ncbi:MAG: ATP synthase F1 subunit epsilon [Oscillospiraceae bacterium]|jgi:F-type H+-transporting ATPase subunit epsilon|nr:ATP synthase F1 subunit epsilon [Oscillospiraceae bacterium]
MNTFLLRIMTPEKSFFDGAANEIVFSTPEGRIGVMAGHMPMVTAVAENTIEIRDGESTEAKIAAIGQGVCEIFDNTIEFYVDSVEWAADIDLARAREALERAELRMRSSADRMEYVRNQAAISRALARMKAANDTIGSLPDIS